MSSPATDAKGRKEARGRRGMRRGSCVTERSSSSWLGGGGPYSEEAAGSRGGRSRELPVALGCSVHVVPDADGLFEETLHAAEVDAAVDEVLHGAETGGGSPSAPPCPANRLHLPDQSSGRAGTPRPSRGPP